MLCWHNLADNKRRNDIMKTASRLTLAVFFTIAMGFGQVTFSQNVKTKAKPATKRVAHISLTGAITDSPAGFSFFGESKNLTLKKWLNRLAKVRNDKSIDAVVIMIDSPGIKLSHASELADAIRKLAAVKPVYTHTITASVSQYIVASAGTETWIELAGGLEIVGIAGELTFYRGLMDKFGIVPQFIQVGKYKGAAEPYMNKKPSKELINEYNELFDGLYNHMVGEIAKNRKMTTAMVKAVIDQGPFSGTRAHELGLADKIVTRGEVLDTVKKQLGGNVEIVKNYGKKAKKDIDFNNPFSLFSEILTNTNKKRIAPNTIAIIHADGAIVSGSGGEGMFGGKTVGDLTMIKAFKEAQTNPNIKAVIFRISSPGGSALASEMIYQAVKRCAAVKPVIVSISGMGASGGYYIASAGHEIWADSSAIVGSIGVVSGRVSFKKIMDNAGVTTYEIKRGKNAGLNLSRPWTNEEIETLRKHSEEIYKLFLKRVTDARGKKIADIHKVAQGRIFTGIVAKEKGLVDHIGGLADVAAAAKKRAGIKGKVNFVVMPRTKTFADLIAEGDESVAFNSAASKLMGIRNSIPYQLLSKTGKLNGVSYLLEMANILNRDRVMLAMPYHIQIKD